MHLLALSLSHSSSTLPLSLSLSIMCIYFLLFTFLFVIIKNDFKKIVEQLAVLTVSFLKSGNEFLMVAVVSINYSEFNQLINSFI